MSNPDYKNIKLRYIAYDRRGTEQIRLIKKPTQVLLGSRDVTETHNFADEGYKWKPLRNGGLLIINRLNANEVTIID